MSEQNILNPSVSSTLNPDYPIPIQHPQINARWQAASGKPYLRRLAARGRIHNLTWTKRLTTDAEALEQWFAQYDNDFFTYVDWERSRYFTGMIAEETVQTQREANNQVTISAAFIELPGLPMFQYPGNWGVDSIFLEERNGFGDDMVKLTGTGWVFHAASSAFHPAGGNGTAYQTSTTNDAAEWIYFGYGFRVWSPQNSLYGIVEVSLDGTVVGTFDPYSATLINSAALFTWAGVPLGLHRVKLRCTGTKNVSSTGFLIWADAIEVMR